MKNLLFFLKKLSFYTILKDINLSHYFAVLNALIKYNIFIPKGGYAACILNLKSYFFCMTEKISAMNIKYFILSVFLISFIFFTACNSAIYEIVEVEEPVEIKEELKPPQADIKEDIKEDTKPPENKFNEKQVISRSYVIQIGAFNDELNAEKYLKKAKNMLPNQDIVYKNIEGLYKIRLGKYITKEDAIPVLEKIRGLGFNDSFIVELTYVKIENN